MAAFGLDAAKQRVLFRARLKLTWRQFVRERGRIIGALFAALFLVPATIGAGVGTAIAYRRAPEPWPTQILGLVLVALWGLWIILPVFAFPLNEGLDLTRLLRYPLSRRELVASLLLGALLDYPMYFTVPLTVAVLYGWGLSPAMPIVLIAVVLSYGHMVLTSQLVLTAAGGLLRSRRFRDVSIILVSLFGSTCYFLQRGLAELGQRYVTPEQLASLRPLRLLQWTPPGAAARAIAQAHAGAWLTSVAWLLYSTALLAVVAWIWWVLLVRLTTGGGFLITLDADGERRPEGRRMRRRARRTPSLLRWVPDDLRELMSKELKAAWRTPKRRVSLLQGILLPVIVGGVALLTDADGLPQELPSWSPLGLPLYGLFLFWTTAQNMLGWEGDGLPSLLLTPVPRQRIFVAKGIALASIAAVVLLPIGIGLIVLIPGWTGVAGVLTTFAVGAVTMAVAAVASVLFPYAVNLRDVTGRVSTGGNLVTGLANLIIVPIATVVISAPPAAVLGLAYWLGWSWLGYAGAVAGLVYGVVVFGVGTALAGRLLVRREPEVVEATHLVDAG